MTDAPVSAADDDNRERLRAFRAAVAHREAMHRLADELKAAFTVAELGRIVAVMNRVGDEYEAWLRTDTVRLQARNDWRDARRSNADAVASAVPSAG
jgi:hypothetical protein